MNTEPKYITMPVGMDAHLHFRQGKRLRHTVYHTARQFGYGIVMPNTQPRHVISADDVLLYRGDVLENLPNRMDFTPLMTVSLTKDTTPEILVAALACEHVYAVKFYAGHTTNAQGVDDVTVFDWAFELIQASGKPLLLHGEAGTYVDTFDREKIFYETSGEWILSEFPGMKVVCEHITTKFLVQFVQNARVGVGATITPQHLLSNRNDMLGKGGLRPDLYCLPILKREEDRSALLLAATSGSSKFFLGTDSAPHASADKYSSCGCAGCFTSPYALELYAEAFDSVDALSQLPLFASRNGLDFYGLQPKPGKITIEEVEPWAPESTFSIDHDKFVVPYMPYGMTTLRWKVTRS